MGEVFTALFWDPMMGKCSVELMHPGFFVLCLLCSSLLRLLMAVVMQLCRMSIYRGKGELIVRGSCFLLEEGLEGRTDFLYFMSSSTASRILTC